MASKLKKEQTTILSEILNIDENVLLFLSERGLIDYPEARTVLIKDEYDRMLQGGMLNKNIVSVLMSKYKISKSSIEKAIYKKRIVT